MYQGPNENLDKELRGIKETRNNNWETTKVVSYCKLKELTKLNRVGRKVKIISRLPQIDMIKAFKMMDNFFE